jgi:hypothetical protein
MDKLRKHAEGNEFTLVLTGDKCGRLVLLKGDVNGDSEVKGEVIELFIWDGSPKPEIHE